MLDEQFQARLMQYLDGTLPAEDAAALFAEMATTPEALDSLDVDRRLDALLLAPAPEVNWNALQARISGKLDQADALEQAARSRFRIGPMPAGIRYAVAACLFVSAGVAAVLMLQMKVTPPGMPGRGVKQGPVAVAVVQIAGPSAERSSASAVAQISIGPGPVAQADAQERYAELVPRTPRVVIASGVQARQDAAFLPY